jgi:hypothetical protein
VSDPTPPDADDQEPESQPEPEWVRRRRLAAVFGDVLPDTTTDERDPTDGGNAETPGETGLKQQVPPHHGG